jgi:hypothetical protein
MANRESAKRAERRRLAKSGRRTINVEVMDWDAWVEILKEEDCLGKDVEPTSEAVTAATVKFIWDDCRQYRKEIADEEMGLIQRVRTGLWNPEALDAEFEERAKKEPHLIYGKPKTPLYDPPKPDPGRKYTPGELLAFLEERSDLQEMDGADPSEVADATHELEGDDTEDYVGDGDNDDGYAGFEDEKV